MPVRDLLVYGNDKPNLIGTGASTGCNRIDRKGAIPDGGNAGDGIFAGGYAPGPRAARRVRYSENPVGVAPGSRTVAHPASLRPRGLDGGQESSTGGACRRRHPSDALPMDPPR